MSNRYSPVRVLVVDDHMMMRTMILGHLKNIGFKHMDSANSGTEALTKIEAAAAKNAPFNIILLDWHMPDKEGIDVLEECRNLKAYDDLAIVMLTAEQDEKNVLKAIEAGATSYLVKPVSMNTLHSNIDKVMEWLDKKGVVFKQPVASTPSDHTARLESLYEDLKPVVAEGMKTIFSELFHIEIIPENSAERQAEKHMVCVGLLKEANVTMVLRFFFDRILLKSLLHQIYAPEYLERDDTFQDAAAEIVNILCGQVKHFLNNKGFNFEFAADNLSVDLVEGDDDPILNIAFSLNQQQAFLIDLDVNQATG